MHRAALNGLKMVGNKLSAKEEEAYHKKETHKPRTHKKETHKPSTQRVQVSRKTPTPKRSEANYSSSITPSITCYSPSKEFISNNKGEVITLFTDVVKIPIDYLFP
jgi:hypothetical protein